MASSVWFVFFTSLLMCFVEVKSGTEKLSEKCSKGFKCVPENQCTLRGYELHSCQRGTTKVCCPERYVSGGPTDFIANDYYEEGYRGPPLSSQAKKILQSYKERECGVRHSFYAKSTHHEIDHGTTKYGEFPWHAAILVRTDITADRSRTVFKYQCGGTVINHVLVLTAAHCIKGMKLNYLKIRMGDWNLDGTKGEIFPAITRDVKRAIIHDEYDSTSFDSDVAILVLNKPINLKKTPNVSPICIPPKHERFHEFFKCYIVGWENDIFKPNYGSNLLKVASVSLLKDGCAQKLKEHLPSLANDFINKDYKCIQGIRGLEPCGGEGGGPVVCPISNEEIKICKGYDCKPEHYFLAGIISWGTDNVCGKADSVTVITDLTVHRDWVVKKAGLYGGIHNYVYDDHDYDDGYDYGYGGYDRQYYLEIPVKKERYSNYHDKYTGTRSHENEDL